MFLNKPHNNLFSFESGISRSIARFRWQLAFLAEKPKISIRLVKSRFGCVCTQNRLAQTVQIADPFFATMLYARPVRKSLIFTLINIKHIRRTFIIDLEKDADQMF